MSKPPGEISRPRSTKNVYFFKSGDQVFDGVRLPVNLRRYRTLDALLDDLSGRIPGLSRGVRQVRTPHGRQQVNDINQLRHMGGYVCTEKLHTGGQIPGVDFKKFKTPKDFLSYEPIVTALPSRPDQAAQGSPKKKKKKKKKKQKKKKQSGENLVAPENQSNQEVDTVEEFVKHAEENNQEIHRDFDDSYESEREREEEEDEEDDDDEREDLEENYTEDHRRYSRSRSREDLDDIEEIEDADYPETEKREHSSRRNDLAMNPEEYDEEEEERFAESPNVVGKPSFSAPGTPAEHRKFDDSPLSPLDSKKLRHVQRRRLATKQVKAEDYTLPSREVTVNSKLPTGKKKKSTKMNIPPRNNGPRNSFDDRMKLDDYNSDQQERIFEAETVRAIANRPQTNSVHGSRPGTKDSQIEESGVGSARNRERDATPVSQRESSGSEVATKHSSIASGNDSHVDISGRNGDIQETLSQDNEVLPDFDDEAFVDRQNTMSPLSQDSERNETGSQHRPKSNKRLHQNNYLINNQEQEAEEWHDFISSIHANEINDNNLEDIESRQSHVASGENDNDPLEHSGEFEEYRDSVKSNEWINEHEHGTRRKSEFTEDRFDENNDSAHDHLDNDYHLNDREPHNRKDIERVDKEMRKLSLRDSGVSSVDDHVIIAAVN